MKQPCRSPSPPIDPVHKGNYTFWKSMPKADQVLADMKGTNDVDTAARQHSALTLLTRLVNPDADGSGKIPWPARDQDMDAAYSHALPDWNGHREEILAKSLRLQADHASVQSVLKRYFPESALPEIEPTISIFEASAKKQAAAQRAR